MENCCGVREIGASDAGPSAGPGGQAGAAGGAGQAGERSQRSFGVSGALRRVSRTGHRERAESGQRERMGTVRGPKAVSSLPARQIVTAVRIVKQLSHRVMAMNHTTSLPREHTAKKFH